MAKIPQLTLQPETAGAPSGYRATGGPELYASIARVSGQLADRFGREADRAARREGEAAGARAALDLKMPSVDFAFDGSSALTTPDASATAAAAPLLRKEEGFRTKPYWDVNAWRVGYGSDTITRADGTVVHVTKAMTASRADAERDLTRRIGNIESRMARQFGASWSKLSGGARAGVASVIYNYGHVPDSVAAAIRSGDPSAVASAVGGLSANPKRRAREAALIRGGAATDPGVANAAGAAGTVAASGDAGVTVNVGNLPVSTLPQADPSTYYGAGFNTAMNRIAANRMQTAMREQMIAAAETHEGDAAGLDQALKDIRAGFANPDNPPDVQASLGQAWETTRFSLMRDALHAQRKRFDDERQASAEAEIASRTDNAMRIARTAANAGPAETEAGTGRIADGGRAQADAALAGELDRIHSDIAAAPISAVRKQRLAATIDDQVYSERILGAFSSKATAEERAAYAKQFQQDWQEDKGFGAKISADAFGRINSKMLSQLGKDATAAANQRTAIATTIGKQLDFLKKGYPISDATQTAIGRQVDAAGDPELSAQYQFFANLSDWQRAHLSARPEVLAAQADALRKKIAENGASEGALTTLDVVTSLHDSMVKALKSEPLTFADRAGVIDLTPLDFSSDAAASASLSERVAEAHAVAQHYGVAPKFFTAHEVAHLKATIDADPAQLPQLATTLAASLGPDLPAALSQISRDASVVAHLASLYQMTGDQHLLVEAGQALADRKLPGYKPLLPSGPALTQAAVSDMSGALNALPGTATAAGQAAALIFEHRARRQGIPLDDFDSAASPARALYDETLNEVLGAHRIDGETHGGIGEVNGHETLLPTDMTADGFDTLVGSIRQSDLASQEPIGTTNGIAITAGDIRGGTLVAVAPGRYRVALGDPNSDNPRYVQKAGGGYFTLDIAALKKWRQEAGDPVTDLGRITTTGGLRRMGLWGARQ